MPNSRAGHLRLDFSLDLGNLRWCYDFCDRRGKGVGVSWGVLELFAHRVERKVPSPIAVVPVVGRVAGVLSTKLHGEHRATMIESLELDAMLDQGSNSK